MKICLRLKKKVLEKYLKRKKRIEKVIIFQWLQIPLLQQMLPPKNSKLANSMVQHKVITNQENQ
jgi:hypothetical protein